VADETSGVLRLDGGGGSWAWHLDGSWRDSSDYEIPGVAERAIHHGDEHGEPHHDDHHDDHHDEAHGDHDGHSDGVLENSFVESQSGTFGLSYIGQRGFIGASVRRYESNYGIPAPHMHGEEGHSDRDHDEHGDEHEHDHDSHDEGEFFAAIDMEQTSYDVKARLTDPLPGFNRLTVRMGYNDYFHEEVEMAAGEAHDDHDHDHDEGHAHDGEMHGTVFDIQTTQARLELESQPFAGWVGAFGLQYDDQDFTSVGAEAYVAPNTTESLALFGLQERRFNDVTLSIGARLEQTEIHADLTHAGDDHHEHHDEHGDEHDHHEEFEFGQDHREFDAFSSSVGAIWEMSELWQSTLNLSYSQRAPQASELFANGPHLATFAFERGSDALDKETSVAWDWGLHRHSTNFDFKANAFYKDIDDFIYWADTDDMLDGFPVRLATQADAELYGTEVVAAWQIHETSLGDFDVHASHDWVRGKRAGGENLPRISPQRVQLGLDWHDGPWRANVEWQHLFDQDKTAHAEPETPRYDLVSARVAYRFDLEDVTLTAFVEGKNLTDDEARVHTSYLRDYAPLPGRNFVAGLRGEF
jgi:iron complex outermembrane receptor protein